MKVTVERLKCLRTRYHCTIDLNGKVDTLRTRNIYNLVRFIKDKARNDTVEIERLMASIKPGETKEFIFIITHEVSDEELHRFLTNYSAPVEPGPELAKFLKQHNLTL